ncbi:hypothetical protein [Terriglobus sp. ADX1]|uniref:hypothetical protein n=1 Tax=Terriglobus sp. ADX1 TaxID=2794063 RepID=UPI002FE6B0F4
MMASATGEELDVTADLRVTVARQLERILAHSTFRNSRRCQAFLRYVVEEKLDGNAVQLKERTIGIAVFQQPLDYDTNANAVVRVTAGEVRRRLAQYYFETDADDEILIELPLGSYVPDFRPVEAMAASHEVALVESVVSALSESDERERPTLQVAVTVADAPRRPLWNWKVPALLLICGLVVGALIAASAHNRLTVSESDRIWKEAFQGQNVLLCAGSLDSYPGVPTGGQEGNVVPRHPGFSFTTARTAAVVGSAIGHSGGGASLLPVQDTKVEDLQRAPAVLIGAFNNEWTMRLQAPLRYQFVQSPGVPNAIVDTKVPNGKRFGVENHSTRDYGIFAHFKSPATGQPTVIVAGLGMHGTAAVRIFLSSPELLSDFAKTAPAGWEKGNYEIVLASDLVNNLADPPKVAATYFW